MQIVLLQGHLLQIEMASNIVVSLHAQKKTRLTFKFQLCPQYPPPNAPRVSVNLIG